MPKLITIFLILVLFFAVALTVPVQGNQGYSLIVAEEIELPKIVIPYPESMESKMDELPSKTCQSLNENKNNTIAKPEEKLQSEGAFPLLPQI